MLLEHLPANVLDEESKSALRDVKIRTVFDLIETDSLKIARLCFGGKLSEVNRLKSELIKKHCPSVQTANELLCRDFIKTQLHSLDGILGGKGLEASKIYEVYGPPGVGKTQLGIFLTAVCCENTKSTVYIDTKNNFSVDRLNHISRGRLTEKCNPSKKLKRSKEDHEITIRNILSRCQVAKAFTLHRILDVVFSIEDVPRFLVIDSIASVVVPLFGNNEFSLSDISATLSLLFSKLRQLSVEHNSTVLLVNNAIVDRTSGDVKPALGKFLDGIADVRIQTRKSSEGSITLTRDDADNANCVLEIKSGGFFECSWD